MTEAVKRTPHNIILLDEFEKAHRDVRELFYQVFDEGRLDDSDGDRVNFRNCLIFVTSNVGSEVISRYSRKGEFGSSSMEAELNIALNEIFLPALVGRMNVVPYQSIGSEVFTDIALNKFQQIADRLENNFGLDVSLDDKLIKILTEEALENGQSGGRGIIHLIDTYVVPRITDFILDVLSEERVVKRISVSYADQDICVEGFVS